MRKIIAIALLITFCLAESRTFWAIGDYYLNFEYISEVLCINKDIPQSSCKGKCHLRKQLKKAKEGDSSSQQVPKFEWDKRPLLAVHTSLAVFSDIQPEADQSALPSYTETVTSITSSPPTPPPKV